MCLIMLFQPLVENSGFCSEGGGGATLRFSEGLEYSGPPPKHYIERHCF